MLHSLPCLSIVGTLGSLITNQLCLRGSIIQQRSRVTHIPEPVFSCRPRNHHLSLVSPLRSSSFEAIQANRSIVQELVRQRYRSASRDGRVVSQGNQMRADLYISKGDALLGDSRRPKLLFQRVLVGSVAHAAAALVLRRACGPVDLSAGCQGGDRVAEARLRRGSSLGIGGSADEVLHGGGAVHVFMTT